MMVKEKLRKCTECSGSYWKVYIGIMQRMMKERNHEVGEEE